MPEHGAPDGDERAWAFLQGCPYCSYIEKYENLQKAQDKLEALEPGTMEHEAMFGLVTDRVADLIDYGLALAMESDRARRRMKESVYN